MYPPLSFTAPALAALLSLGCLSALAADTDASSAASVPAPSASTGALHPIATLDLPRYMGTWFEIAKYPNWFQKKCTGATQAQYRLQPDDTVQVINRCRLQNGVLNEAMGVARQLGAATSAQLQVRFAPAWLGWLPGVWGYYWVIDLDAQYQLVAVSEPKKEYLWILARTPQVDAAAYQALLQRLAGMGFDLGRLETSPQD